VTSPSKKGPDGLFSRPAEHIKDEYDRKRILDFVIQNLFLYLQNRRKEKRIRRNCKTNHSKLALLEAEPSGMRSKHMEQMAFPHPYGLDNPLTIRNLSLSHNLQKLVTLLLGLLVH